MTSAQIVCNAIEQIPENELFIAGKLYDQKLSIKVTECAYYKTLERLCKSGKICKIAKGTYYRPRIGQYGMVPPAQKDIVSAFTEPDRGMVVGYPLYNSLKLTTQVSKTIEVFSAALEQRTKRISNVLLQYYNLRYTPEVKSTISIMEVLQNFDKIQDLNYARFVEFCEQFSKIYSDEVFEEVYNQKRYPKRTISFLQDVLNFYCIRNDLNRYLSSLSKYKHPSIEEIYKSIHTSVS